MLDFLELPIGDLSKLCAPDTEQAITNYLATAAPSDFTDDHLKHIAELQAAIASGDFFFQLKGTARAAGHAILSSPVVWKTQDEQEQNPYMVCLSSASAQVN